MKKLNVIYLGWGERFKLGVLAEDGKDLLFEYSPGAIERGLQLSPYKLPLRDKAYGDFPDYQLRLPGMICDALPDGWGMLLMDRIFRTQGKSLHQISPLERLALIGDKAMGALAFEPSENEALRLEDVQLLKLARETREVLDDESEILLRKLMLMGGSPQGARPKVLLNFDRSRNSMSNTEAGTGIPILVKFPTQGEHKEVCAIEAMYGRIAIACGLRMPTTNYFDLDKKYSAFGIERFDRFKGMRVPMHTAAGAAHANFRIPNFDYTTLLRLTRLMTGDEREVLQAFERCVFNVVFNNRDDHTKNFSYLMNNDGRWQLSPGYDLSFCEGPNVEHQMDICGEAREPSRKDLLTLAKRDSIAEKIAVQTIERIATIADRFNDFVEDLPIRTRSLKQINNAVDTNRKRLL